MSRTFLQKLNMRTLREIVDVLLGIFVIAAPFFALMLLTLPYYLSERLPSNLAIFIGTLGIAAQIIFVMMVTDVVVEPSEDESGDDEAKEECDQALCPCASHTQPLYFDFNTREWLLHPCQNEQCPCIEHTNQEEFSDGKWIVSE